MKQISYASLSLCVSVPLLLSRCPPPIPCCYTEQALTGTTVTARLTSAHPKYCVVLLHLLNKQQLWKYGCEGVLTCIRCRACSSCSGSVGGSSGCMGGSCLSDRDGGRCVDSQWGGAWSSPPHTPHTAEREGLDLSPGWYHRRRDQTTHFFSTIYTTISCRPVI